MPLAFAARAGSRFDRLGGIGRMRPQCTGMDQVSAWLSFLLLVCTSTVRTFTHHPPVVPHLFPGDTYGDSLPGDPVLPGVYGDHV